MQDVSLASSKEMRCTRARLHYHLRRATTWFQPAFPFFPSLNSPLHHSISCTTRKGSWLGRQTNTTRIIAFRYVSMFHATHFYPSFSWAQPRSSHQRACPAQSPGKNQLRKDCPVPVLFLASDVRVKSNLRGRHCNSPLAASLVLHSSFEY